MKIKIIQIGKTKHDFIKEAEAEYHKRLIPLIQVETITLKDQSTKSANNPADIEIIKRKEAEEIEGRINRFTGKQFIIALDENGKQYTSPQFAGLLAEIKDSGPGEITFIIGGCYGLHKNILNRADQLLSFSKFTFTHEMIRPLLLEQLYRAHTIIKGKKYHY